jgi:hypothetical protein
MKNGELLTGEQIRDLQRKWREAHLNYFKEYYRKHHKKKLTLVKRIKIFLKGGQK